MPFNLLLLPLIGGFYFFTEWEKTVYFAKRQEGERLLFYSSLYGLLFLAISFGLSALIPYSDYLLEMRRRWAYSTPAVEYSGISSFALFLGLAAAVVLNRFGRWFRNWRGTELREGEHVLLTYGTQLEQLLYRSLIEYKRVMVTLKSGKVYIGRVTRSVSPQEAKDFFLLPSLSGYRDEKHRMVMTTNYDYVYKAIVESGDDYIEIISDFGVVIPISEVTSASLFRADVHTEYFPHQDPPDPTTDLIASMESAKQDKREVSTASQEQE